MTTIEPIQEEQMTSFRRQPQSQVDSALRTEGKGIDHHGAGPPFALINPRRKPTPSHTQAERSNLLETEPNMEIHTTQGRRSTSQFWNAVMLPPAGFFLIDLDWAEGSFKRLQSIICPATSDGLNGMHAYESLIVALSFVAPAPDDAQPRAAPLQINAIGIGLDSKRDFGAEVLMRTFDGQWHACRRVVDVADMAQRETLVDLTAGNTLVAYLAFTPKPPKGSAICPSEE
jgi:hypothetical protein